MAAATEHKQVVLHGVPVVFPFEPYATQREYMASVVLALQHRSNALLESPTGTGKTLSMLCAVLGWLRHKKQGGNGGGDDDDAGGGGGEGGRKYPPIFYCSRTHSQLSQVVREFKRTVYADDTTMAVLGSREHLCVHTQVTSLPSGSQGFHCAQLRGDNKCRFFRGTAKYMAAESRDVAMNAKRNVNLHDIEDLCNMGRQETFCPYYYEREIAASADIIFLPYTYLMDRAIAAQLPLSSEGAIVIFDEAHNVPSALTSAGSFSITSVEMAGAIRDLGAAMSMMESRIASAAGTDPSLLVVPWIGERGGKSSDALDGKMNPDEFLGLVSAAKIILVALEKAIDELEFGSNDATEMDEPGLHMARFLATVGIDAATFGQGRRHLKGVMATAAHVLGSVSEVTAMVTGATGQSLTKVLDLMNAVYSSGLADADINDCCRFVLQRDAPSNPTSTAGAAGGSSNSRPAPRPGNGATTGGRTLSFWCLDISVPMRAVCAPLRQVLLTSGTLSPMNHFAAELGVGFDVMYQSKHVINTSQQLRSFVLKAGPDGSTLNGSYAFRSVRSYYGALGASIVNLAVVVPDGMLVFFPSYAAMNSAISAWKAVENNSGSSADGLLGSGTVWGQLSEHKTIYVEPPTTAELQTVITEYQASASQRRGAILFGVARGKISEGVDFADRHARCVVVTGIPFANSGDLFVKIKRRFLSHVASTRPSVDGKPFTGDDWYKNEALRSVNQCIGRVIRHSNDYGVIVLADERFVAHTSALPSWITADGALTIAPHFRDCFGSTAQFFKGKKSHPLAQQQRHQQQQEGGGGRHVAADGMAGAGSVSTVTATDANRALLHHQQQGGGFANNNQNPVATNNSSNAAAGAMAAQPRTMSAMDEAFTASAKFSNLFGRSSGGGSAPPPLKPLAPISASPPVPIRTAAVGNMNSSAVSSSSSSIATNTNTNTAASATCAPAATNPSTSTSTSMHNGALTSKTLIAQLKEELSAEAYQSFKRQLEALIALKKRAGTATSAATSATSMDDSSNSIKEAVTRALTTVVDVFYAALGAQRALAVCQVFRVYVSTFAAEYDGIVSAHHDKSSS